MIDGYVILSNIKTRLDADTDLNVALKTVDETSKVFIGSVLPQPLSLPIILMPDLQQDAMHTGQGTRLGGRMSFEVHIYCEALGTGREDLETIYHIWSHVDSIIRANISLTSLNLNVIELQTAQPTMVSENICRKILTYTANALEKT